MFASHSPWISTLVPSWPSTGAIATTRYSAVGRPRGVLRDAPEGQSDLDSADRHAAVEMAAPSLQGEVVLLQSGIHAAFEPVHLPGSGPLVGEPFRHAAACPTGSTA